MQLLELQRRFAKALNGVIDDTVIKKIKKNGLTEKQRLQVYRNNFFITLTQALKDTYPTIVTLVGESCFSALAREYILQYPSLSGNLHHFGAHFATFLEGLAPVQALPYLPDMARLSWAYHTVFHAAKNKPLDFYALDKVSKETYPTLKFHLNPACRLLDSYFPLLDIWQLCQVKNPKTLRLTEKGQKLLIYRHPSLEITIEELTTGEFILLSAFDKQLLFKEACTLALHAEAGFNIEVSLKKHIFSGTINAFSLVRGTFREKTPR